ncbi:hypothetical protein [Pseudorhodoferax sp. Leaf267]|nr:hypothetical protein [Pseudorhodoferax sp. Leaf267]
MPSQPLLLLRAKSFAQVLPAHPGRIPPAWRADIDAGRPAQVAP